MNINDYALLFAVSLPVATIVGMQVFLFATGERGTGLLPGLGGYPAIAINKMAMVSEVATVDTSVESSNDEMERLAA